MRFHRRYYEREREKVQLRMDLLDLPVKIADLERSHSSMCSTPVRKQDETRFQKRLAGYALGRPDHSPPILGPYPEELANARLLEAKATYIRKKPAAQGPLQNRYTMGQAIS